MTGRKKIIALGLVFMTGLQGLTGCGSPSSVSGGQTVAEQQETKELVYESSMELSYAENFSVDYYEGGYKVLTTMDGTKILTVPEDQEDSGRDRRRYDYPSGAGEQFVSGFIRRDGYVR